MMARTAFGREMREKHFLFAKDYINFNQGTPKSHVHHQHGPTEPMLAPLEALLSTFGSSDRYQARSGATRALSNKPSVRIKTPLSPNPTPSSATPICKS